MLRNAGTQNKPSHIINIGSIAGLNNDSINAFAYGTSKAAIHHLSGVLAKELVKEHINVNAIAPGFFNTKLTESLFKDPKKLQTLAGKTMINRNGEERDLFGISVFLCSDANSYITGQTIFLDGGFTAQ